MLSGFLAVTLGSILAVFVNDHTPLGGPELAE